LVANSKHGKLSGSKSASFPKKIIPMKLSEWNQQAISLFLNLSGMSHLIPVFQYENVRPEQLGLITNDVLEFWNVKLMDRKQLLYHLKMLIRNRFLDENHKEKCSICRCTVEELLKQFSIELNVENLKEMKVKSQRYRGQRMNSFGSWFQAV
jgi:hypothetical protein